MLTERLRSGVVTVVLVGLFSASAFYIYDGERRNRLAAVEGYEHMDSVELDGQDGKRYKLDIYRDDLHVIPGQHKILARIWSSATDCKDQKFMSGNRLWLKSIGVRCRNGQDELIFSFKSEPSPFFHRLESVNVVVESTIIGHPQRVEQAISECRSAGMQ